jgi:PII-like signaling protein
MGFGKHGRVHRKRLFGISDDRPVTITVVDRSEKIDRIAEELQALLKEGLIVVENVTVIRPDPA